MAENPYWKSLLAISTAASDQTKGSGGEPRVLDEENRKWLEQVMSDLVKDTDPAVQLDNVMKSLHCYAADATALKEGDLDSLEDLAIRLEDLLSFTPLTQQFVNSGGLIMLRQFIENHNEPLRVLFAKCILTFTDNNPPAQKAVLDSGILEFMLKYLEKEDGNEKLKVKYLGGVSGTVRSNENTFEGFLKLTGPDILTKLAVDYSQEKVAVKSARVLASIAYNLQDSDKYADYLLPNVIKSYRAVAARNRNDEKLAELEYIRDFFERYVPKEKLNTELLSTLIDGLEKEYGSEAQDQIKTLLKKYA